ncbi:MAG: carbamoyl-phosphate synthase (glutamine-hydrolyzing) large subunit [Polyangiaceae bacterium]
MFGQYLPKKPRRVLVLGSGALKIGEAGEFDYSGSQALKAFKEEGIYTVLLNPNIATIQTGEEFADKVYFLPVDPHFVEEILKKEQIDAITVSFGGQTALNCGVALDDAGVLAAHDVRVLGTPLDAVRDTEDRKRFVARLDEIGVKTARARACSTVDEVRAAAKEIGLPVILRAAYALGGKGSKICETQEELETALSRAFASGISQVLVEESLRGWKEIEYEIVRDSRDSCIAVCNMENVDPLGIHTGESIVVAPSQTLNNREYQMLRSIALKVIRHLGIVGECNIQYALDPHSEEYRVIEVNARLSRSSALASKATGYPLAYVAAKIALGYALADLPNSVTRRTSAFFEPALDYIVCKVPRWDLQKFSRVDTQIGSEMKSVGEVMSVDRTFAGALQKALRMLDIGAQGFDPEVYDFENLESELRYPSTRRIFAVAKALSTGMTIERVHELTRIDRFFLCEMDAILKERKALQSKEPLTKESLLSAKLYGFSDKEIGALTSAGESAIRALRHEHGIRPALSQIDTLAGEYPAETNYVYLTYSGQNDDSQPSPRKKILVIGGGAYRIGSSVEFDWCCVSAVRAARELGYEAIVLNCNPETVSTDYDVSDRLIFDEISLETVLDIYERENPVGVILSMGGQAPNNLAMKLERAGVRILGTTAASIDRAEDREKFSALLDSLGIDQPKWATATSTEDVEDVAARLGGFPVLVRPSYVLSGAAMTVAHDGAQLKNYLSLAAEVSKEYPVVISKFEQNSKELELDGVADRGEIVLSAISEHVENAGVHSGDATLVLPPQKLYIETVRRIRKTAQAIVRSLEITGPFNIQFLARNNDIKVIECNLRASRSMPFVSKVTGRNFIREATRRMLGVRDGLPVEALDLDYVAVKAAQFSFSRLAGADPTLGVEMASTGEVGCFGDDLHEALLKALVATGFKFPKKGVLLSLGPTEEKTRFLEDARALERLGLALYATPGTYQALREVDIACSIAHKLADEASPTAMDLMRDGKIDLVINIPRSYDTEGRPDGYLIRRTAIDRNIPLLTNLQLSRAVVDALIRYPSPTDLQTRDWRSYLERT